MEEILIQALKQAEQAEIYISKITETPVQFETNRLKNIQTKQSSSVALRIIRNGRIGYATSTRLDDIVELVENGVATSEFGQKAEFDFPSATKFKKVSTYDKTVEDVTLEKMTDLGNEMVQAVTQYQPEVICEASITKAIAETTIINSRGGRVSYKESAFGIGIEGQVVHGSDMLFVGEHDGSCHPILDVKKIIKSTIRQLRLAKKQAFVETKRMPVIFTPEGTTSALVLPLMSAFNGKTVLEGASPIGNRLGEKVFDEKLTLWDDATLPYRTGSRPSDDEGVPTRKISLIDNGVVASFVYDLQTAGRAKKESTGNAHRSAGSLPGPSINALVFENGSVSFAEMLKDIKEGLVVEQLIGAGQGNTLGGDFSGNVLLGFKVENGKITGRVKDTMVSGNIYQMLKNITAIGSDGKWIGGAFRTPSFFFADVSVSSR